MYGDAREPQLTGLCGDVREAHRAICMGMQGSHSSQDCAGM